MRKFLILIALAATTSLFAQSTAPTLPPSPRPVFPDNYSVSPCAPDNVCESFAQYKFIAAARTFLGFTLNEEWMRTHWTELEPLMKPGCTKIANCYTVKGTYFTFCNDAVVPEMRRVCDRYSDPFDNEQCLMFAETYVLGLDQNSRKKWEQAQKCALKDPQPAKSQPPIVWMVPEKLDLDYKGYIAVYALDPDTNLPVPAHITVQDTNLFASGTPLGRPFTYYPFKWPVKLVRVPNAQGHRDVVPPTVTVKAEGYPDVTFTMPVVIPKMNIAVEPPLESLKAGRDNLVTFKITDATSGKPIEVRLMMGDAMIGDSNKPVVVKWPRGTKRPEIWATSLFHRYNDVVVLPAER